MMDYWLASFSDFWMGSKARQCRDRAFSRPTRSLSRGVDGGCSPMTAIDCTFVPHRQRLPALLPVERWACLMLAPGTPSLSHQQP